MTTMRITEEGTTIRTRDSRAGPRARRKAAVRWTDPSSRRLVCYYAAFVATYWVSVCISAWLVWAFIEPSFLWLVVQLGVHVCIFGAAGCMLPRILGGRLGVHALALGVAWLASVYAFKALWIALSLPSLYLPAGSSDWQLTWRALPFTTPFEVTVFVGLAVAGSGIAACLAWIVESRRRPPNSGDAILNSCPPRGVRRR